MDDDGDGIIWMIDGRELPFEPMSDNRRPWLEESASWGMGDGAGGPGEGEDDEGDGPSELLWV